MSLADVILCGRCVHIFFWGLIPILGVDSTGGPSGNHFGPHLGQTDTRELDRCNIVRHVFAHVFPGADTGGPPENHFGPYLYQADTRALGRCNIERYVCALVFRPLIPILVFNKINWMQLMKILRKTD